MSAGNWTSPTRPWWGWLLFLPQPVLELGAVVAASIAWIVNLKGCRRGVSALIGQALGCSRARALGLAWQATHNAFLYALDSAALLMGSPSRLRQRAQRGSIEGAAQLQQALLEGRGVVLAASFHACFYDALLVRLPPDCAPLEAVPLHLVVPRRDALLEQLCKRIAELGGRRCQFIIMGQPAAAVLMARALQRGEIVLCMVDNVPEDAAVVVVPFLGRPALMPAGFLRLAQRSGSAVLTCHTSRQRGRFITRLRRIAPAAGGADGEHPIQPYANALALALEQAVQLRPGGWNSWLALAHRWHLASELTKEL